MSDQGSKAGLPASFLRRLTRLLRHSSTVFLVAAVLLPAVLFALAASASYCETRRQADILVERTTRILEEHAVKVFETNRLVIEQVRQRLENMDWSRQSDQAKLQALLIRLQREVGQVSTITVVNADGRMRASGRTVPADPGISFTDRDWFRAFRDDPKLPFFISRAYTGRQSKVQIFNLAIPYFTSAGAFDGVIAESIDRSYFEQFYRDVETQFDHSVTLVRSDGAILANYPDSSLAVLPANGRFMAAIRSTPKGSFIATSPVDDVLRIYAYRKVGPYAVYVRFGIGLWAAMGPWRANLYIYGIVAALASLTLAIVALFAARQTQRERNASLRWRATAAELEAQAAERERVEQQLRQMQKMEAIGRLTGGIAHDFNNLLTVVMGNLELTQRALADDNPRATRLVTNALEGASRASNLTHRLLAFSRQQALQPRFTKIDRLILDMSDLLRVTVGETISFDISADDDLWPTLIDPNQLENALLNLVVNARDAMPDGGSIFIKSRKTVVDATFADGQGELKPGPYVEIAVRDTGDGIPPDVLAQVFEPFFTTKPVGKGTGLGLSQVYGFARQSGGHVAIASEVGKGTTIRLLLPKLEGEALDEPTTADAAVPGRARGEAILVVEDEDSVRQFTVTALKEAGYRVMQAADGGAALDLLKHRADIALLFTDVVLKGPMNGRVLAQRAVRIRRGLPVLFASGYTRDTLTSDGHVEEGVNFLPKPFSAAELTAQIRLILDKCVEPIAMSG